VRYSKLAFRLLVRLYGCDLTFTPMMLADSFYQSEQARVGEFTTCPADTPTIAQFAANEAHYFAGSAELVAGHCRGVDLNCGCPQRWAMKEGIGACLIDKPEFVADVVRQTRARISDPDFSVSVKIRVHPDIRQTVELVRRLEAAGVSWVTVHGRTRKQKSSEAEPVDLAAIRTVRESVSIPVVANGDVVSLEGAQCAAMQGSVHRRLHSSNIFQCFPWASPLGQHWGIYGQA
jgi:tRNA-dihydrouridine synthase 4